MKDNTVRSIRPVLDEAFDRAVLVVMPPLTKEEVLAVERVKGELVDSCLDELCALVEKAVQEDTKEIFEDARAEAEENVWEDAERRAAAKTKGILEEALSSLGRMG